MACCIVTTLILWLQKRAHLHFVKINSSSSYFLCCNFFAKSRAQREDKRNLNCLRSKICNESVCIRNVWVYNAKIATYRSYLLESCYSFGIFTYDIIEYVAKHNDSSKMYIFIYSLYHFKLNFLIEAQIELVHPHHILLILCSSGISFRLEVTLGHIKRSHGYIVVLCYGLPYISI